MTPLTVWLSVILGIWCFFCLWMIMCDFWASLSLCYLMPVKVTWVYKHLPAWSISAPCTFAPSLCKNNKNSPTQPFIHRALSKAVLQRPLQDVNNKCEGKENKIKTGKCTKIFKTITDKIRTILHIGITSQNTITLETLATLYFLKGLLQTALKEACCCFTLCLWLGVDCVLWNEFLQCFKGGH